MLGFGSFLLSLIGLVVIIVKMSNKNNRLTLASNGYFLTKNKLPS
nr:putative holin-like toxin [Streptococcus equi]